MIVRFASTCDRCEKRSAEYTCWPHCRECLDDICPACQEAGTLLDRDGYATCLCKRCARDIDEDIKPT